MHFVRSVSNRQQWLGAALSATLLFLCDSAAAYCRTSVCNRSVPGERCVPERPSDCGVPLFWAGGCFGWSVNEVGSKQVPPATVEALMQQAFNSWSGAACPDGLPSLSVTNLGRVACSLQEYNDDAGNTNVIVFRDDEWPYAGQGNTLALTTVTYNLDTGEIFDADLEVNGTDALVLTTSDTDVQYDLLSIVTHETGHMLGLSHSDVPDATMKVEYIPGDISLRQLTQDDIDAICAAYPPSGTSGQCDPEPRGGLQSDCGSPAADDGCSCATPGSASSSGTRGWLAALLLVSLLRRRRR